MLVLSQPITTINGFKIGDKVRLKDGDGRPHIIKAFAIDGLKEFFFVVQFEDGTSVILDNVCLLPSDLDEAAINYAYDGEPEKYGIEFAESNGNNLRGDKVNAFKAGAEWQEREIRIFLVNSLV